MQEVCVWEVRVRTNGRGTEGGRGAKRRGGGVNGGREQGRQPWRRIGKTIPCQAAEAAARTGGSVRGVSSGHSRRQQQQHVWVRAIGPQARSPTASEEAEESAGSSAGTKWARPPSTWEQIPAERKWASQPALSLCDGAKGALIGALPNFVSFSSSNWQRETGRIQGRATVWKGKARFVNSSHSWHEGFLKWDWSLLLNSGLVFHTLQHLLNPFRLLFGPLLRHISYLKYKTGNCSLWDVYFGSKSYKTRGVCVGLCVYVSALFLQNSEDREGSHSNWEGTDFCWLYFM